MTYLNNNTLANETGRSGENKIESTECYVNDSNGVVVVRVLVYCIIILASLIGNCVIIRLVKKEGRTRNSTSMFIATMAISDLLLTVVYMPRVIAIFLVGYAWQITGIPGAISCKSIIFLDYVGVTISILTVMVISTERCVAVVFPYKAIFTPRLSKLVVGMMWFVALSTQWPFLYDTELVPIGSKIYCFIDHDKAFGEGAAIEYYNFNLIALFSLPLSVTIVAYTITVIKLKSMKRPGASTQNSLREQQNRRVVVMVLAVVTLFIMCRLLYFICLVLYAYRVPMHCEVLFMRLFLSHLNSAITPYLYAKFSARYRRAFMIVVASIVPCFFQVKMDKVEGDTNESQIHTMRNVTSPGPLSTAVNTVSKRRQIQSKIEARTNLCVGDEQSQAI